MHYLRQVDPSKSMGEREFAGETMEVRQIWWLQVAKEGLWSAVSCLDLGKLSTKCMELNFE